MQVTEEKTIKKKKKKEKKLENNSNGTVVADVNSNNLTKSGKKRKNEDAVKEFKTAEAGPLNAWSKIVQNSGNHEQPPTKKQKQKEAKANFEVPEEKETG